MGSKKRNNLNNISKYNNSNKRNFTHQFESDNVSYNLPTITLEDLDLVVINFFDKYFEINNKPLRLINGMVSNDSIQHLYPELYNVVKETVISPFLVVKRTGTERTMRNNPSYKPVTYVIPKKKAQGIVYEEWSVKPPLNYNLTYSFIFVSSFYDNVNDLVNQISIYFENKRNMITYNKDRFTIRPKGTIGELFSIENINDGDSNQNTQYALSFELVLEGYTRDVNDTVKKERPNSYTINFNLKDKDGKILSSDITEIRMDENA